MPAPDAEVPEGPLAADERFAVLYRHCPAGVVLADPDGVIGAANPAFLRLAKAGSEDDLVGTRVSDLGAGDRDRSTLVRAILSGDDVQDQIEIRSRPDGARSVRLTVTTVPGDHGRYPILLFEDVHELRQLQETFHHQALHDPLTGLPNAAHFRSRLEALCAEDSPISLLYVDVDGFKVVNDGLGADVADLVLRGVAGPLRSVFAHHEAFIARLFGDGFAIAVSGDLDRKTVVELSEQAIREVAKPVYAAGIGIGVSASIGIATAGARSGDHENLMRSAQVALHRAKALGKAQWVVFDPESGEADRDRYRLAAAIAGAIELGEITVTYQPHVVLPDARIVTSLNAALVWNHPARGQLRSAEFFPLAEMTGMTVPLGRHLLAQALRTKAEWQMRFGDGAPMVCLTLPRRMAIDADLVGIVRAELAENGLEPRHLMLCVDVASLVDERGDLLESMSRLAHLGLVFVVTITGLPDLELIAAREVPAPAVMLTGPIVESVTAVDAPEWACRTVSQLVARADELGIKVGAYGVASQEQAELLHSLGVVVASGGYQPEYLSRTEAEVWAGRTFPMG
ncbi:diguanylate cyclase domain-containing protein [Amycolatopsis solani]|uniref:diguanylate cyclase domain-containing protein n=1 Tax=Amycolatopsis solani TaxID=3028615 RepID=UPI0025B0710A|nr:diguanylate cyclase [Amycolatopsis sp. MEP2-6]